MLRRRLRFLRAPIAALTLALAACGQQSPSSPAPTTTIRLSVEGMHCDGCVNAITSKVKGVKGVTECEVSLEERRAVVTVADPSIRTAVEDAIKRLGYTVGEAPASPSSPATSNPSAPTADAPPTT